MATERDPDTPLNVMREEQAKKAQNEEVLNKREQQDEVPPTNPRQHPTRQTR